MPLNPYKKKRVRTTGLDKRQEGPEAVRKLDLDRANYTGTV